MWTQGKGKPGKKAYADFSRKHSSSSTMKRLLCMGMYAQLRYSHPRAENGSLQGWRFYLP